MRKIQILSRDSTAKSFTLEGAPGFTFHAEVVADLDDTQPWERSDCHGIVRHLDSRRRALKRAGERIIAAPHCTLAYDIPASLARAKAQGWGLSPEARDALETRLGRPATPREVLAEAVQLDFNHIRGWATDSWWYVGIKVRMVESPTGRVTADLESVWGFESTDAEGLDDAAADLAQQLHASWEASQATLDATRARALKHLAGGGQPLILDDANIVVRDGQTYISALILAPD